MELQTVAMKSTIFKGNDFVHFMWSIYEIFTNLDKRHVAEFPFSLLFLCGHFIPGQIINLSFLLCLLQMPEIGSLLFVILLSDACLCESLNIFKVNLKTFTVMCHLMYHTALSSYAFSLQGILYIMWWDFCKSNSTVWVIMKIFSLESTWENRLWAVFGKKRCTFIAFIKCCRHKTILNYNS